MSERLIDRRIKFRHLQCFLEVTHRKSVVRAAEALNVTQPAVSKTLSELEEILGARLLERSRSGVALTAIGEVFLHYAGASIAAIRQGFDSVAQARMTGESFIRIGVLPSVAARVVPQATLRFKQAASGAVINLVTGPNPYLLDQLREGRLDLVVGRMGAIDQMIGLSFAQLYSEQVVLAVRAGHPLARAAELNMAQVVSYPVLFPNEGAAIRPMVESLLIAEGIGSLPDRIETVSNAFGRAFVRQSDAVWFISSGVVAIDVAEGNLVELGLDTSHTLGPVGLSTRSDEEPSPAIRLFINALREVVQERQPSRTTHTGQHPT
jgi:LysR family pca operon transcriptional activator|tara:strand:+ start:147 stop:1112 length:966 start_codon:yes stop_codon:yes gene_type:complete